MRGTFRERQQTNFDPAVLKARTPFPAALCVFYFLLPTIHLCFLISYELEFSLFEINASNFRIKGANMENNFFFFEKP